MEDLQQLSDDQLINLFQNNKIDAELKSKIIAEIDSRELNTATNKFKPIDSTTKIRILFTSLFLYKWHIKESSQVFANGDKEGYKTHWRYFIYGIVFYIVVLLLAGKYIIKPFN